MSWTSQYPFLCYNVKWLFKAGLNIMLHPMTLLSLQNQMVWHILMYLQNLRSLKSQSKHCRRTIITTYRFTTLVLIWIPNIYPNIINIWIEFQNKRVSNMIHECFHDHWDSLSFNTKVYQKQTAVYKTKMVCPNQP